MTKIQNNYDAFIYLHPTSCFNSIKLPVILSKKKKFNISTNNFSFFSAEENSYMDGVSWSSKPIETWTQEDSIGWLMMAASCMCQSYSQIQQSLALPGKQLLSLSKSDFVAQDPIYGEKLYNMLHSQAVASSAAVNFDYYNTGQHHHHHHHHQDKSGGGVAEKNFKNEEEKRNVITSTHHNNISGKFFAFFFFFFFFSFFLFYD